MISLMPGLSTHLRLPFFDLLATVILGIIISGCTAGVEAPVSTAKPAQAQLKSETPDLRSQRPSTDSKLAVERSFDLTELSIHETQGQTTLHVKFSEAVTQYRHYALPQPSRIVLDILGVAKDAGKPESFTIGTNLIGMLRISSSPGQLRLVVDIASAKIPPYVIEPEDGGLKLVIGTKDRDITKKRDRQLVHEGKRLVAQAGPTQKKKYVEPEVSLIFDDVDIKQVLRFLGEVGGKNILITDDVKKKITVNIKEPIPWDQALDLLVDTNNLGKEQVGNVIRISSLGELTRERSARAAAEKAKENEGPIKTIYLTVNYAKVKDLADKISKMKSPAGVVVADDQTNTILVRDINRVIEESKAIVAKFDVRTPQVLIESNLIETTPSFSRALGMELDLVTNHVQASSRFLAGSPFSGSASPGVPSLPIPTTGFRFGYLSDNLRALLSAAENEGNVKIISRPSVVTLNNVPSTIKSERILRIALPSSTNIASGSGAAAGTAVATEKIPVGINLTVTPQVSSDGFVLLNIKVKSSSVANSPTVPAGTNGVIPFDELNREAEANVLVRDGETIVIGGILKDTAQDSESGIPYLKNIPVFGWLFKNHQSQKDLEELVVFITPRIASAGSENLPSADQLWREQMKKTQGDQAAAVPVRP